jgi:UDP-N-acetylmuramoyl-L-alanine---L-glutamate ligase
MSVRFSELDGAAVGVWGAGREIASFAQQLSRRLPSARIVTAAFDSTPDPDVRETLLAPDALLVSGEEILPALSRCDVVVRSPGVSIHRPELRALATAGVPVTTATALWLAERGGDGVIGVTGTKGKSTTAALISQLLRASGRSVGLAGNIGVPALDLLDADLEDVAVVELSSYQIADLAVGPAVAVFTNLFPEHLDWHGSEATYRREKLRLLELPGVRVRVLGARDEHLRALHASGEVRYFGASAGWDVVADAVTRSGVPVLDTADLPLLGTHNAMNLCAALTALEAFGVDPPPLPESLAGFRALPHRLQTVAAGGGVSWVDDSISTTPESTLAALASFPGRDVIVIGGGQDRGQDFAALASEIAARGAAIVGVPSNGARLVDAARRAGVPEARALQAADLAQAVELARSLVAAESVVVLSPAAPSYDNYPNFEARGERFAALARAALER